MAGTAKADSRYELLTKVASGGMATVYVGRVRGAAGFWRLVAIKRAHPHLVEQPAFREMLVAEAQLASRIHHTNVVSVLDVEEREGELLLVLDYVDGSSLSELVARAKKQDMPIPPRVVVRVVLDATAGLQAAHDLTDVDGTLLGVVHRDVSPHNILIGSDGVGRIADFGIAKVLHHGVGSTSSGVLKGKLSYMAPEYVVDHVLDARSDVFGMGVVLWELLAGRPLFRGRNEVETLSRVTTLKPPRVSEVKPDLGTHFDAVVARALSRDRDARHQTAGELAADLERAAREAAQLGSHADVASFLKKCLGAELAARRSSIHASTQTDAEQGDRTAGMGDSTPRGPEAPAAPARTEPVTLATGDVMELEPSVRTRSEPLPLVKGAGVDSTQPSFAHSQIRSHTAAGTPSRRRWWIAPIAVLGLGAGALALSRSRGGTAPAASSAPSVEAPSAVALPSQAPAEEPTASSTGTPPPATSEEPAASATAGHGKQAVERKPDAGKRALPRTKPKPPHRTPGPRATGAPPVDHPRPPAPKPSAWSPPANPYSK